MSQKIASFSALVEEMAAAAQSLQQQASALAEAVAGFELPEGSGQGGQAQLLLG